MHNSNKEGKKKTKELILGRFTKLQNQQTRPCIQKHTRTGKSRLAETLVRTEKEKRKNHAVVDREGEGEGERRKAPLEKTTRFRLSTSSSPFLVFFFFFFFRSSCKMVLWKRGKKNSFSFKKRPFHKMPQSHNLEQQHVLVNSAWYCGSAPSAFFFLFPCCYCLLPPTLSAVFTLVETLPPVFLSR